MIFDEVHAPVNSPVERELSGDSQYEQYLAITKLNVLWTQSRKRERHLGAS